MKIISRGDIGSRLKAVRPTHIAVAYLGEDWREYLGNALPSEIIVSPTFGTNPRALAALGEAVGWENVHLLKELHAKFYLSENAAIVGSCNLTRNGLHGELLEETAVFLGDPKLINDLRSEFERLREAARRQFKTTKAKLDAVHRLERTWGRGVTEGFIQRAKGPKKRSVAEYVDGNDSFYLAWWTDTAIKLNEVAIKEAFDGESQSGADMPIGDALTFLEADDIQPDKWVLCWQPNAEGLPDRTRALTWMHIDKVIKFGAVDTDDNYTKLAITRTDRKSPPIPFHIDRHAKKAIFDALELEKYRAFVWHSDLPWSIEPTIAKFRGFMSDVKKMAVSNAADT